MLILNSTTFWKQFCSYYSLRCGLLNNGDASFVWKLKQLYHHCGANFNSIFFCECPFMKLWCKYDEYYLQTLCQIKLWNFLLQLEMTKKTTQSFVWKLNFSSSLRWINKNKLIIHWWRIGSLIWPSSTIWSLCSKIRPQCEPLKNSWTTETPPLT